MASRTAPWVLRRSLIASAVLCCSVRRAVTAKTVALLAERISSTVVWTSATAAEVDSEAGPEAGVVAWRATTLSVRPMIWALRASLLSFMSSWSRRVWSEMTAESFL
ncbi:hypothetical protein C8J56DRAFT_937029 [Mycena floridula]|nr:hypothetical protein C8J56DRAFT_937029 [Mycena floridula]